MQGKILKGVGGFYTVAMEDGRVLTLRPAGKLRKKDGVPLPGDDVIVQEAEEGMSFQEILPRENELLRPRVVNVAQLLAVVSAADPPPDFLLLDKLLHQARRQQITPIVVMNKCDLATPQQQNDFLSDYQAFDPLCVSMQTGDGIQKLKTRMQGIVCFAGQSGVGKSSIMLAVAPQSEAQTGEISQKTGRGKHTTRHAQLIPTEPGSYLVDTPGFGLIELPLMPPQECKDGILEFERFEGQCRFDGCLHEKEPGCAVKMAVANGEIPQARYLRYLQMLEETKERWNNRYGSHSN